jgi:hypothetical protein
MNINESNLKNLKKLEGESFRFTNRASAGMYDVVRIDKFDPEHFVGIPYVLAKEPFYGIVYRHRKNNTIILAKLGRNLIGEPIKIITCDQIEALKKSDDPYEQRMAQMAISDPVGFLMWC